MTPEMLLSGPLEPTNEWSAVVKIAGIKLREAYRRQHGADFVAVMPTNLYGPGDNYDLENSHVPLRPDGMPRKLLDVSRINALGWRATIPLREGLHQMYADFLVRFGAARDAAVG